MSGEERQSDLAVMDANEYKNKTRLESILTQRQKVFEARDQARDLLISGEIQPDGRNLLVLNATRQYLEEVWNLLLRHARQQGTEEEEWGSVYLTGKKLGEIELRGRKDVLIDGLSSYLYCQRQYVQEWTEEVRWRYGDNKTRTHREIKTVPVKISRRAFRLINQFLDREHDLDIQFEELDDTLGRTHPDSYQADPSVDTRPIKQAIEEAAEKDEGGIDIDMRAVNGDS
jgi:hypothetical protein